MTERFIPKCNNCPDLSAHVHYNGEIRLIKDDSMGISVFEIESVENWVGSIRDG